MSISTNDFKLGITRVLTDAFASSTVSENPKVIYIVSGQGGGKTSVIRHKKNELKEEGIAVLRTDYTLSDKEFMKIAQEVVEGYGSGELGGYYWLGVIYLTDEEGREK